MIKCYLKNQKGATIVASGLLIASLLGFAGLVTDVGNIYIGKAKMQDTADAAALAGVQEVLGSEEGKRVARNYVKENKQNETSEATEITWNSEKNQLTVTLKKDIPTYFIKLFGYNSVPITVHAAATRGNDDNSEPPALFVNGNISFYNSDIRGKVYSGGKIEYKYTDGRKGGCINKVIGSIEAVSSITGAVGLKTLNGDNSEAKSNVKKQDMPTFTIPTDAIDCAKQILTAADLAGRSVKLTGIPAIPKGSIVVDLADIATAGKIISDGNIMIKAKNLHMNDPSEKLFIHTTGTGKITLDLKGSGNINATIYAPNGTVLLLNSDTFVINGSIVANIFIQDALSTVIFAPSGEKTFGKGPTLI